MAVNYGLYQLSNSTVVPKKELFPVETYMSVIDKRNQMWERGKAGELGLQAEGDALRYLRQDQKVAQELYGDVQNTIAGWNKANNYEDLVFDVMEKAREFKLQTAGMQAAYDQRMKTYDDIQKQAVTLGWDPTDIERHMSALDRAYKGQKKDPVTGRYMGVYQDLSGVKKPEMNKFIDEAVKGMTYDEGKKEGFSKFQLKTGDDGEVYYTYGESWKRVDKGRLSKIIQSAAANDRDLQNWLNYQGTLAEMAYGDVTPNMLSPEMQEQYADALAKGVPPARILAEETKKYEYERLMGNALAYGTEKYRMNNVFRDISNTNYPSRSGDGTGGDNSSMPPPIVQTPLKNRTGLEGENFRKTEQSVRELEQSIMEREKRGEVVSAEEKARLYNQKARLDNIRNNVNRTVIEETFGENSYPEVAELMDPKTSEKRRNQLLYKYGNTKIELLFKEKPTGSNSNLPLSMERKAITLEEAVKRTGKSPRDVLFTYTKMKANDQLNNLQPGNMSSAGMTISEESGNAADKRFLENLYDILASSGSNISVTRTRDGAQLDLAKLAKEGWKIGEANVAELSPYGSDDVSTITLTKNGKNGSVSPEIVEVRVPAGVSNIHEIHNMQIARSIEKSMAKNPEFYYNGNKLTTQGQLYYDMARALSGQSNTPALTRLYIGEDTPLMFNGTVTKYRGFRNKRGEFELRDDKGNKIPLLSPNGEPVKSTPDMYMFQNAFDNYMMKNN